jgi:glycosyltransferase involved in cell wall biosynthesis
MRIAQIAPLYEAVPPKLYGGTERVVHALVEELVRRGHEVTLFATADSRTSARLVAMAEGGLRLLAVKDPLALHVAMLEEVYADGDRFDVIHSHVDYLTFSFARCSPTPTVTTLHGRLDLPETRRVLAHFPEQRLVSISDAQRYSLAGLPLRWVATVYNGIRLEHFPFRAEPADPPYLVFLGRISPEKGPLQAIEVARRTGLPLKVAAKIDPADRVWAEANFLPLLGTPGVEYLGEVDEKQKAELLGGALALLFPIDWPEPFGLVMIESMACGTPVIAFPGGAVDEVVADGVTGLLCRTRTVEEMVAAVRQIEQLDRAACRRRVERYFSSRVMAERYEAVYRQVVAESVTARLEMAVAGADGRFATRELSGRDERHLVLTERVLRTGWGRPPVDEATRAALEWYDSEGDLPAPSVSPPEMASLGDS